MKIEFTFYERLCFEEGIGFCTIFILFPVQLYDVRAKMHQECNSFPPTFLLKEILGIPKVCNWRKEKKNPPPYLPSKLMRRPFAGELPAATP